MPKRAILASKWKFERGLIFCLFLFWFPLNGAPGTAPFQIESLLKGANTPALSSKASPLKKEIIVIDPGHGGEDSGARSLSSPIILEKKLTLYTALMVKKALEFLGYAPKLTRKTDQALSLESRVTFTTTALADLFVSIHYNSAPNTDAEGIEVFYFASKSNPSRAASSKNLADKILTRLLTITEASSRGVKHGNYFVIRENNVPAVLVEGGFMTNSKELAKLKDSSYLKKVAVGIARGIDDYLTKQRSQKSKSGATH